MEVVLVVLAILLLGLLVLVGLSVRVIDQFERGVVLRFGRLRGEPRDPGLTFIRPAVDRLHKVNMQVITMPVPAQEGITRDNVTVKVDAVVYFTVFDPVRVVVGVQNYQAAIAQVAQASLRSIIGKSELDDLLSNRERLNQGLELMLDSPAVDWGVHIDRVDIKDVALPEGMKRSMSRQAEAERERRSRVITAEGELQASEKLAQAARGHGRPSRGPAAAPAADRRGGGRREELDAGAAVPRRAAPLPRAGDPAEAGGLRRPRRRPVGPSRGPPGADGADRPRAGPPSRQSRPGRRERRTRPVGGRQRGGVRDRARPGTPRHQRTRPPPRPR